MHTIKVQSVANENNLPSVDLKAKQIVVYPRRSKIDDDMTTSSKMLVELIRLAATFAVLIELLLVNLLVLLLALFQPTTESDAVPCVPVAVADGEAVSVEAEPVHVVVAQKETVLLVVESGSSETAISEEPVKSEQSGELLVAGSERVPVAAAVVLETVSAGVEGGSSETAISDEPVKSEQSDELLVAGSERVPVAAAVVLETVSAGVESGSSETAISDEPVKSKQSGEHVAAEPSIESSTKVNEPIMRPRRASERDQAAYKAAAKRFMAAHAAPKVNHVKIRPEIVSDGCGYVSAVTYFYTGGRTTEADEAYEFFVPERHCGYLRNLKADELLTFCKCYSISQGRLTVQIGAKLLIQGTGNAFNKGKKLIETALKIA